MAKLFKKEQKNDDSATSDSQAQLPRFKAKKSSFIRSTNEHYTNTKLKSLNWLKKDGAINLAN